MKKTALVTVFLAVACVPDDNPEPNEQIHPSSLTERAGQVSVDECPNGGITINSGIDENVNGVLDADEVDETSILCHGSNYTDDDAIAAMGTLADDNPLNHARFSAAECIDAVNTGGVNASSIAFDNSATSLIADNVQDALEEQQGQIDSHGEAIVALNDTTAKTTGSNTFDGDQAIQGSLSVSSGVRVSYVDAECTPEITGMIRWTDVAFQGCNGVAWVNLSQPLQTCGKMLEFDNSAGLVTIPDDGALNPGTESFTVEFWARIDKGSLLPLLSKHDGTGGAPGAGWWVAANANTLQFLLADDGSAQSQVGSGIDVVDGLDHHFAIVRDTVQGEIRMYVDGVLQNTATDNEGDVSPTSTPLYLGHDATVPSRTADGTLDELRIWRSAYYDANFTPPSRTECEATSDTNLVGEWKFEEDSGGAVLDTSGNGIDGVIDGAVTRVAIP